MSKSGTSIKRKLEGVRRAVEQAVEGGEHVNVAGRNNTAISTNLGTASASRHVSSRQAVHVRQHDGATLEHSETVTHRSADGSEENDA